MSNNSTPLGVDQRIANPPIQIGDVIFANFGADVKTSFESASPSVRDCAIDLACRGFPVFRLDPLGNRPAAEGWQQEATNDPETVRKLWTGRTGNMLPYNIGIATGRKLPSGKYLAVLDIDVKNGKGGDKSLAALDAIHEDRQETLESKTSSTGAHLFYETAEPLRNSVEAIAKGIDVRGVGGYVVAPGSTRNGVTYTIVRDVPIAAAPAFMVAAQSKAKPKIEVSASVELNTPQAIDQAKDYVERRAPEAIEGAGGNNQTYKVACKVRDFALSYDVAFEIMRDWNEEKAFPPWSDDELETIVRSAYKHAQNAPGAKSASNEFSAVEFSAAEAEFDAVEIDQTPPKKIGLNLHNISSFKWSTDHKYLVQGLLNNRMLAMMSGPSNAGKSPLALDLAAHIATGRPWQGRKVKQGYVLHYSTEGFTGLGNRMEALRREHFADGGSVPLDFVSGSLDLRTSTKDAKAIIEAVNARAAEFGVQPGLVVIDTLSHALGGGDESNPEHVRAVLRNCAAITAQTGAVILLLHHPTKDAPSGYRGSSILLNDIDLLVTVETDKRTKLRTVKTPRVKEFAEIKALAFRIKVIELGNDADGDAITSVVVDWVNSAESEFESKLTPVQEDAMAAFDEALVAKGAAAGSIGLTVGFSEWSRLLRKRLGIEGNSNSSLNYARKALLDNGIIEKTKAGYIRLASG